MTVLAYSGLILLVAVFGITNDFDCLSVSQDECTFIEWCVYDSNLQKCVKDLCLSSDACVSSAPPCKNKTIQFGCDYDELSYCVSDNWISPEYFSNSLYDCFYNYLRTGTCGIPEYPVGYCVLVTTAQGTYCTEDPLEECSTYTVETCNLGPWCVVDGGACVEDPCIESEVQDDGTCNPDSSCKPLTYYNWDEDEGYFHWDYCSSDTNSNSCIYLTGDYLNCGEGVDDLDSVCTAIKGCSVITTTRNGVSRKMCSGQATGEGSTDAALSVVVPLRSHSAAARLAVAFLAVVSVMALF